MDFIDYLFKCIEAGTAPRDPVAEAKLKKEMSDRLEARIRAIDLNAPTRASIAMDLHARRGWYLDPTEMSWGYYVVQADRVNAGEESAVDVEFTEHFTETASKSADLISARFPARARFLKSAVKAHLAEEYILSVPVLLAQADGIFFDTSAVGLFHGRTRLPGRPGAVRSAEAFALTTPVAWTRLLLRSVVGDENPLFLSGENRATDFAGLNRHAVLHGEDLSYDTKINSAKALSLVKCLAYSPRVELDKP